MRLINAMNVVNDFLDKYILPWPVRFLTFRIVILLTMLLLIPLIIYANNEELVLGLNSYLNVMSVAVSSIVLLYSTISEARQKQIAELQEARAQEDHAHVTEMHGLVFQMLGRQNEMLLHLQSLLSTDPAVADAAKLVSLKDLKLLHPRGEERFDASDTEDRWEDNIHHNPLVSTIRQDLENDT